MTGAVVPFDFAGQQIRGGEFNGHPVLVGKDVCDALGIVKYRDALAQLDEDERVSITVDTPGGPQSMTAVTEGGIWSLAFIARSPQVKAFRRWVTHEVLPAIRRTGSYTAPMSDRDRALALAHNVIALSQRIDELEPLAAAAETLMSAEGDYSLRDAAQVLCRDHGIDTGQNRLLKHLRDLGWVDGRGLPYQRSIAAGRLSVRTRTYEHPHTGEPQITTQLRVTGKGLTWLHQNWPRRVELTALAGGRS